MEKNFKPLTGNTDIKFENDERVIGKWQVEGGTGSLGDMKRTMYFLPDGEFYCTFFDIR
ncbi:MAG: hypothetical protein IKO27_03875 [Ruminococcus sp.]|nr:hypothetical protein [Ruminococcus sp.]